MTGSYNLFIRATAEKNIRDLPKVDRNRVVNRISQLAQNPRPADSKKLLGTSGYRMRQGDYRILYTIDDEQRVVQVFRVGHRREVYR